VTPIFVHEEIDTTGLGVTWLGSCVGSRVTQGPGSLF
jgi:hypothetical protein